MIRCCVPGCTLRNSQIGMHIFPVKDPTRCKRWLEAIGRPNLVMPPDKKCRYYVCRNHFQPHNYFPMNRNRTNLKYTAVPDCNLPYIKKSNDIELPTAQSLMQKRFEQERGVRDVLISADLTNENVSLNKPLYTKNVNYTCILCMKYIAMPENNCFDMEKTIMKKSGGTMKDFIFTKVFDENMKVSVFENNYSCESCHYLLAELDEYLWKSKMLKKVITDTYCQTTEKNSMRLSPEPVISNRKELIKDKMGEAHISIALSSENTRKQDVPELLNKKTNEIEDIVILHSVEDAVDTAAPQIIQENLTVSAKMTQKKNHYQCSKCDKTFSRNQDVRRHEVFHTGEMRFSCSVCNKMFLYAASLRSHIIQKHTAQRKFTCELCNLGFPFKHQLERHIRTHDGTKRFECTECEASFIENYNLRVHMKDHMVRKKCVKKSI